MVVVPGDPLITVVFGEFPTRVAIDEFVTETWSWVFFFDRQNPRKTVITAIMAEIIVAKAATLVSESIVFQSIMRAKSADLVQPAVSLEPPLSRERAGAA